MCRKGLIDALLSYGSELRSARRGQRMAAETSGGSFAPPGALLLLNMRSLQQPAEEGALCNSVFWMDNVVGAKI